MPRSIGAEVENLDGKLLQLFERPIVRTVEPECDTFTLGLFQMEALEHFMNLPVPLFPRDEETVWPATNVRLMAERRDRLRTHVAVRKLVERAAATGGLALP